MSLHLTRADGEGLFIYFNDDLSIPPLQLRVSRCYIPGQDHTIIEVDNNQDFTVLRSEIVSRPGFSVDKFVRRNQS